MIKYKKYLSEVYEMFKMGFITIDEFKKITKRILKAKY